MALPSDFVYIKSTLSPPGHPGTVTLGLYLVPFHNDAYSGRRFHGSRLDLDAHEWPQDKHVELLTAAKEHAVAISENMRGACFDLTDTHINILPAIPSGNVPIASKEEATAAIEGITSLRTDTLPFVHHRSPPAHDTWVLPSVRSEKETPTRYDDTEEITPFQETSLSNALPTAEIRESDETLQDGDRLPAHESPSCGYAPTPGAYESPRTMSSRDATPLPKSPLLDRETPGAYEPAQTLGTEEAMPIEGSPLQKTGISPIHESVKSAQQLVTTAFPNDSMRTIAGGTPSPSKDSAISLRETTRSKRKHRGEDLDTSKRQQKTLAPNIRENKYRGKDLATSKGEPKTSAVTTRQRKRRGGAIVTYNRQQKFSEAAVIAARLGDIVRRGGTQYDLGTFQTGYVDLSLLKPERSELTLRDLGPQLHTYTESLIRTGTTASIILSWYTIAYEHQLSTKDRSAMVRRKPSETTTSRRSRVLGIIFAEAIILLARDIGVDAYKLIPALSAGTDVNEPFPSLYCCRDWSLVHLKSLAGFLVKDLLDSEEKSWMQISQEHAVDPAAQLIAKDFSYEDARRALGLQNTIQLPAHVLPQRGLEAGLEADTINEVDDDDPAQKDVATNDDTLQNTLQDTLFLDDDNLPGWSWPFEKLYGINPGDY